ncbi:hypothetical protein DV735_g4002, partial [Chaetothyriales sp. CBS 134920]
MLASGTASLLLPALARSLLLLITCLATLTLSQDVNTTAEATADRQAPRDLLHDAAFLPEHDAVIRRSLALHDRLQKERPVAIRKMSSDPGEKFYWDYWMFAGDLGETNQTLLPSLDSALLFHSDLDGHGSDSALLPRWLPPRALSLFSKRDYHSSSTTMSNLPSEPEFEQAYHELASTLENSSLFKQHPEYRTALKVVSIPERVIQFRVVWEDDKGEVQVNRGYRVQYNSTLGPYKGGLRFHPSVNLSILKFLGFEQIFKNALTGLNMGGGKGGADFDPKGKSDNEIRRFCVAFMSELGKHIGANTDVPAGDIGVTGREIGFLFGQYKKQTKLWEGVLTGKGNTWGGSLIRPEATGYGTVYYVEEMMKYAGGDSFQGKRVTISGSGNVAQYAALKVIELGGTVVSLSDSKGAIIATTAEGISADQIEAIAQIKVERKYLADIATTSTFSNVKYLPDARPWLHVGQVDVALPCATQNEVSGEEAEGLIKAGAKYIAEGSNMGCTPEAIEIFEKDRTSKKVKEAIWYAPGKAANGGGVAVSGLEMAQNSARVRWTSEEVDAKLKEIMKNCFDNGLQTAKTYATPKEDEYPSLVAGSNIAGFVKVAAAMKDQGDWW